MKARLKNYRQAPRKAALVAHLIRGKKVPVAQRELAFLSKKASPVFAKLLASAVANARAAGATPEELFIKTVTVNKGAMQKRGRPFSRGRSGVIRKTMSHIQIELGNINEKAKSKKQNDKVKVKK
ncbi:MAG TPA: 50S ribosomal protein L22 [Candidatus Paceibacterota bacterium]